MITKINTGGSFASAVNYLTKEEKNHEVLLAYGVSYDPQQMAKDFQRQAECNSRVKTPLLHISLNHHPDDTRKIAGKESEILEGWLAVMKTKGIDFEQTQFVIIKHNDREHTHYHLLANKVANNHKVFRDSFIGIKAKESSKKVTKHYELTTASLKFRQHQKVKEAEEITRAITPKVNPRQGFRM